MTRDKPPFRADHVGSLLRTAPVKEARARRARGEISAQDLAATEDREIAKLIKRQEEVGLGSITDGEFHRSWCRGSAGGRNRPSVQAEWSEP